MHPSALNSKIESKRWPIRASDASHCRLRAGPLSGCHHLLSRHPPHCSRCRAAISMPNTSFVTRRASPEAESVRCPNHCCCYHCTKARQSLRGHQSRPSACCVLCTIKTMHSLSFELQCQLRGHTDRRELFSSSKRSPSRLHQNRWAHINLASDIG